MHSNKLSNELISGSKASCIFMGCSEESISWTKINYIPRLFKRTNHSSQNKLQKQLQSKLQNQLQFYELFKRTNSTDQINQYRHPLPTQADKLHFHHVELPKLIITTSQHDQTIIILTKSTKNKLKNNHQTY